jgi:hypothetical protein
MEEMEPNLPAEIHHLLLMEKVKKLKSQKSIVRSDIKKRKNKPREKLRKRLDSKRKKWVLEPNRQRKWLEVQLPTT